MRAAFFTFGCKVNQYETQCLMDGFSAAGFDICPGGDEGGASAADVYVVNSCTVTAEGDAKVRKLLRRLRREHPGALIALTGCWAQAFPDIAALAPEADVITGSANRAALLPAVQRALATGARVVEVSPHRPDESFEPMRVRRFQGRTRAFLKIQDGCERYCAYCIIPAARGPFRSKPLAAIREEVEGLVSQGFREVVLVGINLSCYGVDLGEHLTGAVRTACAVPGIERVRLSSLEPELLGPKTIAALAGARGFCPQFHLSLQSGCDATLRRMNRHYTAAAYRAIVENIRAAFPNPAITTDVMVGFPGETPEEFEASVRFCEEIGFAKAHVFAYSRRPGTAADAMPGQIDPREKARRSHAMIEAMARCRARFLEGQAGRVCRVLFEQEARQGVWSGYTENYTPVLARDPAGGCPGGKILPVRLLSAGPDACAGEIVYP